MTEKRFKTNEVGCIVDYYDHNLKNYDGQEIVDLLNELNDENEQLKQQLLENNCDNCKYSKAIYADVECRKKGFTEWKFNCDEFKGDVE